MNYRHVFGPVASGRLGRSLGLDLLGSKICSFDCLYCEVGPNRLRFVERAEYAPFDVLLEELRHWLRHVALPLDYMTLGGSGEPCLHGRLGDILQAVAELAPAASTAVLTNSSLLPDPQVRRELAKAHAVLPSMDTLVPEEFRTLNRPHKGVDLQRMAQGLLDFRSEYEGRIFLEVLLAKGYNDSEENLALLEEYVGRLRPERVDVVTMSRPGAYAGAMAVDTATLERFRRILGAGIAPVAPEPHGPGIAIRAALVQESRTCTTRAAVQGGAVAAAVYNSLRRRPQTAAQLAQALDQDLEAIDAALADLDQQGSVQVLAGGGEPFYKAV